MTPAQWWKHLRRVRNGFRWRLLKVRKSDYHCLTIQIPVDDSVLTEVQSLTLQQVLRGPKTGKQ